MLNDGIREMWKICLEKSNPPKLSYPYLCYFNIWLVLVVHFLLVCLYSSIYLFNDALLDLKFITFSQIVPLVIYVLWQFFPVVFILNSFWPAGLMQPFQYFLFSHLLFGLRHHITQRFVVDFLLSISFSSILPKCR